MVKYRLTIILLVLFSFVNFYFIYSFENIKNKILANQPNMPQPRPIQTLKFDYEPLSELTEQEKIEFIESMKLDLNTAVIDELVKISGIGPGTAKKIIDYRKKNGYFKSVEDVLNVPGIGETKFNTFKEYITAKPPASDIENAASEAEQESETQEEPVIAVKPVKRSEPRSQAVERKKKTAKRQPVYSDKVDINSGALDDLTSIKGIGKNMAQRIIDYREENNGFKNVDDLANVKGISAARVEKLRENFDIKPYKKPVWKNSDVDAVSPVNLNTCSYTEIRQFPYITASVGRAIIEYRKENGNFKSVNDLRKIREIDYTTFTRLKKMFYAN